MSKKILLFFMMICGVCLVFMGDFFTTEEEFVPMEISLVGSRSISQMKIALLLQGEVEENLFMVQAEDKLADLVALYQFTGETCYVDETQGFSWYEEGKRYCQEGYDLLLTVGWHGSEAFEKLKREHPEVDFVLIGPEISLEGVKNITFEVEESAFIMGVMMGLGFPEENVFGVLGNHGTYTMGEFLYGFQRGLEYCREDASVMVLYMETYLNQEKAYEKTMEFAEAGVSVVFSCISSYGNVGVFRAMEERREMGVPMYGTSIDVDQTSEERPYVLGGLMRDTGYALEKVVSEYLQEVFSLGSWRLSLTERACSVLGVTDYQVNYWNDEIFTEDVVQQAREVYRSLMLGEIELGY